MHVVVCDDHRVFGECLGQLLSRFGVTVQAVTRSVDELLGLLPSISADIILVDRMFPDGEAVGRFAELRSAAPQAKLVLLTADIPGASTRAALTAGASGVLVKSQSTAEILAALERIQRGEVVLSPALLLEAVTGTARQAQGAGLLRFLTDRERDVLERLVQGETTEAIASGLGVRTSTARTHIQSVLTKLGVHSRLEAAAVAVRERAPAPS